MFSSRPGVDAGEKRRRSGKLKLYIILESKGQALRMRGLIPIHKVQSDYQLVSCLAPCVPNICTYLVVKHEIVCLSATVSGPGWFHPCIDNRKLSLIPLLGYF